MHVYMYILAMQVNHVEDSVEGLSTPPPLPSLVRLPQSHQHPQARISSTPFSQPLSHYNIDFQYRVLEKLSEISEAVCGMKEILGNVAAVLSRANPPLNVRVLSLCVKFAAI